MGHERGAEWLDAVWQFVEAGASGSFRNERG